METKEIVARLVAICDATEKQHPDYICDGVLSPMQDGIIDLCLDALGVPADTTLDYPNGDARAFCRDWYWSEVRAGNIAAVVKDLQRGGFTQ